MPTFLVPLHEYNKCHAPAGTSAGGQFCSDRDAFVPRPTLGRSVTSLVRGLRHPGQRGAKQFLQGARDPYFAFYTTEERMRYKVLSRRQLAGLDRVNELDDQVKVQRAKGPRPELPAELKALADQRAAQMEDLRGIYQDMDALHEEITRRGIREVAVSLGVDPDRVKIVKESDPRTFTVGGIQWKEGGHYQPMTGDIQVNLANNPTQMDLARLLAHEISHVKYEVWRTALEQESAAIKTWKPSGLDALTTPNRTPFSASGEVRPQFQAEFKRTFPAHAAVGDTWGHGYTGHSTLFTMQQDDGFTNYSRAYWRDARRGPATMVHYGYTNYLGARRSKGATDRAIDETLAEVASWRVRQRYRWSDPETPSPEWRRFAARISAFYRAHTKRGGRG